MNCNKLMIGDILDLSDELDEIIPCKVVELHTHELYVIQPNDAACDIVGYDMVRPLPLTQGILEKNGFVKRKENYIPNWNIYILNGNFFLEDRLEDYFHFNGNKIFRIKFVHELQHALRLCGLHDLADSIII